MSKKRIKQYLMLLTVIGLVSIASGSGTFASFTAETTNAGNTFATGTLLLSDSVHAGTACYSDTNAGNSESSSCSAVINDTNLTTNHTSSNDITITNTGSLPSSNLSLFSATGCSQNTVGTFDPGSNLTHAADLCHQILVSVEQDTTAGSSATATDCWVGTEIGGGNHACDPTQGTALDTFLTAHATAGAGFLFGGDTLAASAVRNYEIYLYLPSKGNSYQGLGASFDLTWHIDQ